jgi:hypothetical protein
MSRTIGRDSVQFLRSARCDVLYVGYMGHIDMILAYCLNWRRRSTLVFDPCISMYNTLVEDRKIVTAHGFKARVIRLLDEVPCRLADVVLTDTLHHGKYFESALGVPRERIHRVFVAPENPFSKLAGTLPKVRSQCCSTRSFRLYTES